MTRDELARRIAEVSLLRGEFTLRSGRKSNYYLDKYRFETQPDVLKALGEMFADRVSASVDRIAGAELGAVALAAAASLASDLPFLIVRKEAKGYGTQQRLEGRWEAGACACLVEDVVTSGGAAVSAVEALREAGLRVSTAVCVVDREEGGVDELARHAVRLRPLFRASDVLAA